ncbi:hypothetical protein KI387_024294 [Taxus chinensis]|uniref:Uncharacterized protein n=1 Tax=Taxus chinensis TaxID=29808 RepID=A0AA38LCM5_TAXCH|nr:hypothetical protein KI387_024294 [Taxus chinensis]
MEEESVKRKERLRVMRMEAGQSGTGTENEQESSQSAPGILSNPFNDSSPPLTSHNTSRFDYYTDPLASFSSNKAKSRINNHHSNASNQSPNGCPNRPMTMKSPMNGSTPVKSYVEQKQMNAGNAQSPADSGPFGSPVSAYSMSSGPQYYSSPLPMSPVPRFNHPSPPLFQHQRQNQSAPRGFNNSSNGRPLPMPSPPRFNTNNTWSQQPNSQPSSQSDTQPRQFYNSSNESSVPMSPVPLSSQFPCEDKFWSQKSYLQHEQHQQNQIGSQPIDYYNLNNESPGPLTPVPRPNSAQNKDSFWSPRPHSQLSSPFQQQQQQEHHQSGSQPGQYNGQLGRGNSWLDPRQSPDGRGSPWSGSCGSLSPSPGSGGSGVSWSEPHGSSGGRGTPWMNSRGRGGRGRGARVHASAREKPDLFVKKSMVEDPWKNLVPVIMDSLVATGVGNARMFRSKGSCSDVDNLISCRPRSISLKKPKVSQIEDIFQSGPSIAESLALAFSDAIGEEARS